jgi:hypothetical protein
MYVLNVACLSKDYCITRCNTTEKKFLSPDLAVLFYYP